MADPSIWFAAGYTYQPSPNVSMFDIPGGWVKEPDFTPTNLTSGAATGSRFSRDGTLWAFARSTSNRQNAIQVYDTATWSLVAAPLFTDFNSLCLGQLDFSPGGEVLAAPQTSSPAVQFFDVANSYAILPSLPIATGTNGNSCRFSDDGTLFVLSTNVPPHIFVFNTNGNMLRPDLWTQVTINSPPTVDCNIAQFSPNGAYVLGALDAGDSGGKGLIVFDIATGNRVTMPDGTPTGRCYTCAWSMDAGDFISGGGSTSPYLWVFDVSSGVPSGIEVTPFASMPPSRVYSMDYNSDSTIFAAGHNSAPNYTLYNMSNWSKRADLSPAIPGRGTACSFNQPLAAPPTAAPKSPIMVGTDM